MQKLVAQYGLDFGIEIATMRKYDEKITLKELEEEPRKEKKL